MSGTSTESAWRKCAALGLPRMIFVTREDKHRADFHAAFRGALETLSAAERNVLRMHVIDGLNGPTGVAVDRRGTVYVSELLEGRMPDTAKLTRFGK